MLIAQLDVQPLYSILVKITKNTWHDAYHQPPVTQLAQLLLYLSLSESLVVN